MGYSVETRTRALDTMPFGSSLHLDMEVWAGRDMNMGYGVGVYWYGFAETVSNRKPDPDEVLNVPPIPDLENAAPEGSEAALKGAVEITPELVVAKPDAVVLKAQNLKKMNLKGTWSQDTHLQSIPWT